MLKIHFENSFGVWPTFWLLLISKCDETLQVFFVRLSFSLLKHTKETSHSLLNSFEKGTARSFCNQHLTHAAALQYKSKRILAKLVCFSQHRLAESASCPQTSVLPVSSFIVPPCSRQEQTTVCERDTDMVSPGSHRSVGTPCRSAVQLAYPSVSLWRSLLPLLDLPPP